MKNRKLVKAAAIAAMCAVCMTGCSKDTMNSDKDTKVEQEVNKQEAQETNKEETPETDKEATQESDKEEAQETSKEDNQESDQADQQDTQSKDELTASNDLEGTNLGAWARMMGSVLMAYNGADPYLFGGYEVNADNTAFNQTILDNSWGVTSRAELLDTIAWLFEEGHRVDYLTDAEIVATYNDEEFEAALTELDEESQLYYELVRYNLELWGEDGLLAWDMCRIAHLAQWGYVAGYLTQEEATAVVEPAAQCLKEHFTSWEEVQMNWFTGYAYWSEIDMSTDEMFSQRLAVYEMLSEMQPAFYDDSLFTQDITPVDGVSYESLMAEIAE